MRIMGAWLKYYFHYKQKELDELTDDEFLREWCDLKYCLIALGNMKEEDEKPNIGPAPIITKSSPIPISIAKGKKNIRRSKK